MSLDEKCQKLQEEYQKDLSSVRQLEEEIRFLHHQITKQSEFTYRMGSVLGDYVKAASEDPASVAAMVADPSMGSLVMLANETIIQIMKRGLTKKSDEDSQFILSLFGVFINVAKSDEGKQYMLEPHFQPTIELFINLLLSSGKDPEGNNVEACSFRDYVKWNAMEMLNALSEHPEAATRFSSNGNVYDIIMEALHKESWNPIRKPALQFLQKLLTSITDEKNFALATRMLKPIDIIGNLQMSADEEIRAAAEAVVKSLHQAESRTAVSVDND